MDTTTTHNPVVLDENPYFADSTESTKQMTYDEMLTVKKFMTEPSLAVLRGQLRWMLSLSEEELKPVLDKLDFTILYLENIDKFESQEAFEAFIKNAANGISQRPAGEAPPTIKAAEEVLEEEDEELKKWEKDPNNG